MAKSKLPRQLAKNASKLHKHIGSLLVKDPFKNYEIRQEYPVSSVNPEFLSNREKFDWIILGLKVVIEVHGIQHFMPTAFGGVTMDEAKRNFQKQLDRDILKEKAANDAGWAFVIVKYNETDITSKELQYRIYKAMKVTTVNKEDRRLHKCSAGAKKQKEKYNRPINNRPISRPDKYNWPSRKIQNRPFPKKDK